MAQSYTIGALAAAAAVHVETVRFYQRRNLLPVPKRVLGSVRRYVEADVARLGFIKRAQAMGFTLSEISELLKLQARRSSCRATRELAATKLRMVDGRISALRELRKELAQLIEDCDANAEDTACPVIARLTLPSLPAS